MKNKIKVCYLINSLNLGGAEMMLYRLLEKLDHKEFETVVVTLLYSDSPLQEMIEKLGIKVHVIGLKSKIDFFSTYKLIKIINETSPDILHTQLFGADILGRILGKALKISVIITSIRNSYYGGWLRLLLIKWTEKFADKTTIVSNSAAQCFIKRKIIDADKLQVIYNGLDPDQFYYSLNKDDKSAIKRGMGLPSDCFILLAVGSLTLQKGYFILLEAISLLRKKYQDFILVIAGTGPLEEKIRNRIYELGLSEIVILIGRSERVPDFMASADLLVLSSLWEGLPGVILEAMASELPVVASSVGGTNELIVDGQTGFLAIPNSVEDLADKLFQIIIMDETELKAMGQAGRKRVIEHFHVNKMVEAYEGLYKEALRDKLR